MYCPKCGSQSDENTKFCRTCGTDLNIVSQAITGQLAPASPLPWKGEQGRSRRRHKDDDDRPARVDRAISAGFMGLGFVCVAFGALYYAPAGHLWWFWMLIPAFTMIGKAISEFVRWKQEQSIRGAYGAQQPQQQVQPPPQQQYIPPQQPQRGDDNAQR